MAEIDIDLSQESPQPLSDEVVKAAHVVVTMGCGEACPVCVSGHALPRLGAPGPCGQAVDDVRAIRDEIGGRVRALLEELLSSA